MMVLSSGELSVSQSSSFHLLLDIIYFLPLFCLDELHNLSELRENASRCLVKLLNVILINLDE